MPDRAARTRGDGPRVRGTNMPALKPSAAAEARIRRLLRMLAALEEAIIRLEARGDGDRERLVERLRALQDDIATALGLDDPGTTRRPDRRTNY